MYFGIILPVVLENFRREAEGADDSHIQGAKQPWMRPAGARLEWGGFT